MSRRTHKGGVGLEDSSNQIGPAFSESGSLLTRRKGMQVRVRLKCSISVRPRNTRSDLAIVAGSRFQPWNSSVLETLHYYTIRNIIIDIFRSPR